MSRSSSTSVVLPDVSTCSTRSTKGARRRPGPRNDEHRNDCQHGRGWTGYRHRTAAAERRSHARPPRRHVPARRRDPTDRLRCARAARRATLRIGITTVRLHQTAFFALGLGHPSAASLAFDAEAQSSCIDVAPSARAGETAELQEPGSSRSCNSVVVLPRAWAASAAHATSMPPAESADAPRRGRHAARRALLCAFASLRQNVKSIRTAFWR